jgi:hypothetical protein
MNVFISENLTALKLPLLPIAPSAREAMIATAPYYRREFRENLAEDVCAAPFATNVIDAPISARYFTALAPGLKVSGLIDKLNSLIGEVLKRPKPLSPSSTENHRCEAA